MAFSKKEVEGRLLVKIDEALSIYEAADLIGTLRECLEENDTIEFDLGAVNNCDTAGIQLILSTLKTAETQNKTIKFIHASETVHRAMTGAGVDPEDFFSKQEA